jgi:methylmalonyl-CoA/ethylmalonyl-CoA epimerase
MIRRLDHVAVAVRDTKAALRHFRDRLGLEVVATEDVERLAVRLTYLDAGNTYVQLVEPLEANSPIDRWLQVNGEGLHHICFGVDDVEADLAGFSPAIAAEPLGNGRGRSSGFLPELFVGVRIECTEFHRETDVDKTHGWIETSPSSHRDGRSSA